MLIVLPIYLHKLIEQFVEIAKNC